MRPRANFHPGQIFVAWRIIVDLISEMRQEQLSNTESNRKRWEDMFRHAPRYTWICIWIMLFITEVELARPSFSYTFSVSGPVEVAITQSRETTLFSHYRLGCPQPQVPKQITAITSTEPHPCHEVISITHWKVPLLPSLPKERRLQKSSDVCSSKEPAKIKYKFREMFRLHHPLVVFRRALAGRAPETPKY